jgi:hypothetical protein
MRGRPERGEYGEHAVADIAKVEGDDPAAALLRQQHEVVELFGRLDDAKIAGRRYAADKWTIKEVLGHMIDDERIMTYRMLCLARGDAGPFASFDENAYVAGANFEERRLVDLMREYGLVRAATIAFLESLPDDAWTRRGTTAGYPATVRGLAFHLAGHELHHLAILRERYRI